MYKEAQKAKLNNLPNFTCLLLLTPTPLPNTTIPMIQVTALHKERNPKREVVSQQKTSGKNE
jgi:hypothetical protein